MIEHIKEKAHDRGTVPTMSIRDYFAGKELLVTGATGLVGRVLIEKILRDLPEVGRVHVLIRPNAGRSGRTGSAQDRLEQEILGSTAFDRLRRMHGDRFESLVGDKLVAVAGDLTKEDLGLDAATLGRLQSAVQVIVNSAAVVSFDAPLVSAFETNTIGTMRILEFARGCKNPLFAQVSTCYVNGTGEGIVGEEPLDPTRAMAESSEAYDVDEEVEAIARLVRDVEAESFSQGRQKAFANATSANGRTRPDDSAAPAESLRQAWVDQRMVAEGLEWSHRRGWNDTYTFTKAMGEQMIVRHHGEVATLIFRPSIIESAFETPEPGWMDGLRMIDPLIVAYGRRQLPDFPGSADALVDLVPVDMVVNALLASIPAAHRNSGVTVFQLATSNDNPLTLREFCDMVRDHFRDAPLSARGAPAEAPPRIGLPSTGRFLRRLRFRYIIPLRALDVLAWPVSFTSRGRRLRETLGAKRSAVQRLAYWAKIYSPYSNVLCHYRSDGMREIMRSLPEEEQRRFDFDVTRIDWRHYIQEIHIPGIRRFVLGIVPKPPPDTEGVPSAPQQAAALPSRAAAPRRQSLISDIPSELEVRRWIGVQWPARPLRKLTRWVWSVVYRYYIGFQYEGVERVPREGPFIVVANHTSHLDTGALLVILRNHTECLHPVAAKDYWFRGRFWSWVSRTFVDAIPFDRHANFTESLRLPTAMLRSNHSLVYFPEGGRSVTGEMQSFKVGIGVLALESGAPIVPANITGSYQSMAKGKRFPRRHRIRVRFGTPISVEPYLQASENGATQEIARKITEDAQKAVEALR